MIKLKVNRGQATAKIKGRYVDLIAELTIGVASVIVSMVRDEDKPLEDAEVIKKTLNNFLMDAIEDKLKEISPQEEAQEQE